MLTQASPRRSGDHPSLAQLWGTADDDEQPDQPEQLSDHPTLVELWDDKRHKPRTNRLVPVLTIPDKLIN